MKETVKRRRALGRGSRTGVPTHRAEMAAVDKDETEAYDWGVDLAGTIKLGGLRLVVGNRAAIKVRSPLRLS